MEKIAATCFFCGKTTEDAIEDGFSPDFCTARVIGDEDIPSGGYGGCHDLASCPDCAKIYLYESPSGDRILKGEPGPDFHKANVLPGGITRGVPALKEPFSVSIQFDNHREDPDPKLVVIFDGDGDDVGLYPISKHVAAILIAQGMNYGA